MESMVVEFKQRNSCQASGEILHIPYEVRVCRHKVEHWLIQCRETTGLNMCPVDGCTESTLKGKVLVDLQGQIAEWIARNPDHFKETAAIAMKYAIGCITDQKTKRIFAEVQQRTCGCLSDKVSVDWTTKYNDGKCITCDLVSTASPWDHIQKSINAFIDANQELLGYNALQNLADVAELPALWKTSAAATEDFMDQLDKFTQNAHDSQRTVQRLTDRSAIIRQRQAHCQRVTLIALAIFLFIQVYPLLFEFIAPSQLHVDGDLSADGYCYIGESWWTNPAE